MTVCLGRFAKRMEPDIFRQEALDYHAQPKVDEHLSLVLPPWTRWSFRILVVAALSVGACFVLGLVPRYAEAPALIHVDSIRVAVRAPTTGILERVMAIPGTRIHRGQVVASVRAQYSIAPATVAASCDGIIDSIVVDIGRPVEAGGIVAWVATRNQRVTVTALFPANFRTILYGGQIARLRIAGYPSAYQDLIIDDVEPRNLDRTQAVRAFGTIESSSGGKDSAFLVVHALISTDAFVAAGYAHPYVDGMRGNLRLAVRGDGLLRLVSGDITNKRR